jgi:Zn-dependent protease with chaperone function
VSGQLALGRRLLVLGVAIGLIGLHWTWAAARPHPLGGADGVTVVHYSWPAAALLLIGGALAWTGRALWLLLRVRRAVADLVAVPPPTKLGSAVCGAGIDAVICVRDPSPAAFCVGAVRPQVIVTTGLVERLGVDELVAVLLHEGEHARRRDPLRRAAWRAAAELLWHVPLVEWWCRRRVEHSELAADRAALARLGPGPLARALTTPTIGAAGLDGVPFDGAADLRVAQLLGDPLPTRRPSCGAYVVSAGAMTLTINLAMCLVETAAHLAR